ncbi:GGDEF domain-containing protein [Yersinia nurmii]|uniref:diguanylate cyclase n=1 Tax=Yersinia nurmii TaxID=685706 RepID=A0AAW7JWP5_9GAMM|nr:GGDEF domain-containing protein [Yersinia nurmii]MDN0086628.1 GGDEF domain-containing protein [Yersinia nurmii]CNE55570.1 cell signaling regulator [Yersinia nurmii]
MFCLKKNGVALSVFIIHVIVNIIYLHMGNNMLKDTARFSARTAELTDKTIPALTAFRCLITDTLQLRQLQLQLVNAHDDKDIEEERDVINELIIRIENTFYMYSKTLSESDNRQDIDDAYHAWLRYISLSEKAISLYQNGFFNQARNILYSDALSYFVDFELRKIRLLINSSEQLSEAKMAIAEVDKSAKALFILGLGFSLLLQITYLVIIFKQVITKKRAIKEANIDPLTHLFNRRKLVKDWEVIHSLNKPITLAAGDIDHFKKINDTYGHPVGDFILCELANMLKKNSRKSDMVIRIGGEEFAIIFINCHVEEAYQRIEKIRKEVEETIFTPASGDNIKLTISFGLKQLSKDTPSLDSLLKAADNNLYKAKKAGRNQTVY